MKGLKLYVKYVGCLFHHILHIKLISIVVIGVKPLTYHVDITPFNLPELYAQKTKYIASDITSDMLSNWLARVGSAIPRGFSRHYILGLLEEEPMTGKEIIDKAILQSGGRWKPSPGLIYPMLGRLLEEGLISETESGKYKITSRGIDIAADVDPVHNIMQKQLDVVMRVGNVGKFMAMDMIDRLSAMGLSLSSNLDKMTEQEREKYKQFLVSELKKLQEQETKKDELRIDSD